MRKRIGKPGIGVLGVKKKILTEAQKKAGGLKIGEEFQFGKKWFKVILYEGKKKALRIPSPEEYKGKK